MFLKWNIQNDKVKGHRVCFYGVFCSAGSLSVLQSISGEQETALECHKFMGNKMSCQSVVNLRCHWSVWGARNLWNFFLSRFSRVFPVSHKRHWLWEHDDTLHWEMVSEVCVVSDTSQELITQVLSSCWKWLIQGAGGLRIPRCWSWRGSCGFTAYKWASLILLQRELESMKRTQVAWFPLYLGQWLKCFSREGDGVEQLFAARSPCHPIPCPGRKVWRTSSSLSATNLQGHTKYVTGRVEKSSPPHFPSPFFPFFFFSFYIRTHAEKYLIALIALLLLACTHLAKQVKLICARFLRAQGPSKQNGSFVWQGPASSGSHPSLKFVRKFNLSKAPFSTLRQARGHLNQNQMYLSGLKITNSGLRSCQQRTTRARATKLACLMKF